MYKKIALLLCLILLSSCSSLRKAKEMNKAYFVRQELAKVVDDLEQAEPTGLPMRTLYLVDLAGHHSDMLDKLARKAKEGSKEGLLIAQLQGDGEYLVKWSDSELLTAQGYLLMGNWVEAKHMNLHDLATDVMVHLAELDTLRAIKVLEHLIVKQDIDRMIRLNGARLLCDLVPDSSLGLKQVMMLTANSWEQFVANTLLDYHAGRQMRYDPRNSREEIFVKMLEARRSGDPSALKEVSHEIERSNESSPLQDERIVRQLRDELLNHELYPEALTMHHLLSESAKREYPYSLLDEYAEEIALIQRYEALADESRILPIHSENIISINGSSFRARWGDVRNVDNWVMEYSTVLQESSDKSLEKPTPEQYQRIRNHLRKQIPVPSN